MGWVTCIPCLPLHGQVAAAPSADAPVSRPEFEQFVSGYDSQEKAVENEIHPRIVAAQSQYSADLEALAGKLEQSKRSAPK